MGGQHGGIKVVQAALALAVFLVVARFFHQRLRQLHVHVHGIAVDNVVMQQHFLGGQQRRGLVGAAAVHATSHKGRTVFGKVFEETLPAIHHAAAEGRR